jgi:hypothetical protein
MLNHYWKIKTSGFFGWCWNSASVIHIHVTACLSRVCEEPSVLILKNAVDMYDSNVSSQM